MTPVPKNKKYAVYKTIVYVIIFLGFIFYLLPVGIITAKNLFKLVVFSGWRMEEFVKKIELFSVRPVNDSYMELYSWMKCLSKGVCSLKSK